MIPSLPEDVLFMIFQHLSLQDVISIRRVCRSYKDITHSRGLWVLILRKEVWDRDVPTPRFNLDHLSSAQIEKLVASSLHLHLNWTSKSPKVIRRRHVTVAMPRARITSLHFITLGGCSCLLSFSLTSRVEPRTVTIECWDLNSLRCKARRTVQWFGGYAVNSDPESTGIIAIKTPYVEILAFDPSASSADLALIPLITLNSAAKSILFFGGTTIIFRTPNDELKILDIIRPFYEIKLEERQPFPDSFEAVLNDEYAIILRPKTLALYSLGAFRRGSHPPWAFLSPSQVHEFQWRIDSCVMQRQISPSAPYLSNDSKPSSLNILIRYSSLFPWPVNLLHHYILYPNDSYISSATNKHSSTTTGFAITSNNLPYKFPPVLSQTIVSPVRLFAITDMALGPYGTAVWFDSHTDYHGEVGQRLAGLMLEASKDREETGSNNITAADQVSTMPSIVFGAHEKDDWNRLAIDEGEGRIAVGSTTGEIIIEDYAERQW
ncbi:hypothetical protein EV368DRAFT_38388 [Lentinula lateritia]|uniref:Uncharacterized protein n=1 Tax=Lentinula aff. lateritia TaxID=2804960 RepID=A0ACC1TUE3_9AGAR|nr:hypothetical protein F5876DRAFT_46141 [Lentinula aff. lateritia]KAJ3853705.1 hypothetical protein EV368DRAFT_38388 [Lentinula lateritia]